MSREIKFRAWLIQEKKMSFPDTIHWNSGYGGALQIHVPNPKFNPYDHIVLKKEPKEVPFWSYINHSLDAHLQETPHQFVLLQSTLLRDKNNVEIYEGDVLQEKTGTVVYVSFGLVEIGLDTSWNIGYKTPCFHLKYTESSGGGNTPIHFGNENSYGFDTKKLKVIGNIYENPELINEPKKD